MSMKIEQILEVVLQATGVSKDQFFSRNRKREIVMARQVFFYLCRRYFDTPYVVLGKFIGQDHATVMHGVEVVKDMLTTEFEPMVAVVKYCQELIRDKYNGNYVLKVLVPFSMDLDKLIETLTVEFHCRVTKQNV